SLRVRRPLPRGRRPGPGRPFPLVGATGRAPYQTERGGFMYSALNGATARTDEPRALAIALFLGSDITAHSIANALVPELLDRNHSVTLYLTEGHPKKGAPKPLHELFFCE